MEKDDLERKIGRHRGSVGRFVRTLAFTAAVGSAAYLFGRFQEAQDGRWYAWQTRQRIKGYAVDGFAWKEGADPTFYGFRPVLHVDSASMTMRGYMIKTTATDTVDAGPIRKDGVIGFSVYDRMQQNLQEDVKETKGVLDKAREKAKGTYHWLEQRYDRIVGKDTVAEGGR